MENLIGINTTFAANSVETYPISFSHGEGIYLYDFSGKQYIDMVSSLAVANFGYKHPRLIKALVDQANKISVLTRLFHNEPLGKLLQRACELTQMDKGFPMSSGVDAVETAVKTARKWAYLKKKVLPGRAEIIVCNNNFHGRTIAAISMSTNKKYQKYFEPLNDGFKQIPFNDSVALEKAITSNTAAFIVEPIQGEAGIIIPDDGYLKACKTLCLRHKVMFIVDEIQTGLGRTGKFLASQYEKIQPDGILLGKALGGGLLPISLFLAKNHLMDVIEPGDHGSTFGGNPLCAYVAYEALNTLLDENLIENSYEMGKYFLDELKKIKTPLIKEVRGRGLFLAIEINTKITTTKLVCKSFMKRGLLSIDTQSQCIRLVPPLTIAKSQINKAVEIICQAFDYLSRRADKAS